MNSGKVEEVITCPICLETYDEGTKCPRMLSCGHSFCHSCLEKCIVKRPRCPSCRNPIRCPKIESIPVNYSLKSLINVESPDANATENVDLQGQCNEPHSSNGGPKEKKRKLKAEGYCKIHENFKEFRCMDCEVWICGSCAALLHKECRTLLVSEARKELEKNKFLLKIEKELGTIKKTKERLTESSSVLVEESASLTEEIEEKQLQLYNRQQLLEVIETLESKENQNYSKLEQLKATVESSTSDAEFSESLNEFDKLVEGKTQKLMFLGPLCQENLVYAVMKIQGDLGYGEVTEEDERYWISSFEQQAPPDSSILIDFRKLLSWFNRSGELPKTFLKIIPFRNGFKAVGLGSFKVVIETDGFSPRANNFVFYCSGLKGPSYRSRFLQGFPDCFHTREYSDYPVVEGIKDDDVGTPLMEAGLYGMFEDDSGFGIQLKDRPLLSFPKFGTVIEGLQHLKDPEVDNCLIIDCGLVF